MSFFFFPFPLSPFLSFLRHFCSCLLYVNKFLHVNKNNNRNGKKKTSVSEMGRKRFLLLFFFLSVSSELSLTLLLFTFSLSPLKQSHTHITRARKCTHSSVYRLRRDRLFLFSISTKAPTLRDFFFFRSCEKWFRVAANTLVVWCRCTA